MNFEIDTRDVNFGFNEEHIARLLPGYARLKKDGVFQCRVLRGRLPHLQSTNYAGARIPE